MRAQALAKRGGEQAFGKKWEFIIALTTVIVPLMIPATQQYLFKDKMCKKGLLKFTIVEHNA